MGQYRGAIKLLTDVKNGILYHQDEIEKFSSPISSGYCRLYMLQQVTLRSIVFNTF